jgi:hypothetical protein
MTAPPDEPVNRFFLGWIFGFRVHLFIEFIVSFSWRLAGFETAYAGNFESTR